ncbi:MAG TPA: rhomboid family intramembrane serine protease [Polyangiaceae bacterium]|nr:rhomboid family intramembrane serine protease [Polyangiaceae bacterium]
MDGSPAASFNLPRPGRCLSAVLATLSVVGILSALFVAWIPAAAFVFNGLTCQLGSAFHQPWRLLTSGLLTSPEHWGHLLFSLLGLYFLGAPLDKRWGPWRFLRLLLLSVLMGNLVTIAADRWLPADSQPRFHPGLVYGPSAAIAAIAVAWSREYPDSIVNLFFFVPLRGKMLLWITIGFCVLDLVYPSAMPEGVLAPFGGVITGLLLGGSPSLTRTAWLHLRLALLKRRSGSVRVQDVLSSRPPRRSRTGGPPLRVVSGGLDEVLKKRTPPKDKRYLN